MGDSAPTAEELLAHNEWLTRLARALVGDATADDVVQDTYEAALAKPSHREGQLRPWLGGVARNMARMAARSRGRRERREQAVPVHDDVPSPEQLLARAQVQQKVNRLVLELHEPLRSTLLLRFFEGLSAAEIARAQGIPAATVRSRLKDALDRIRVALDAEHGNDRRAWAGLLLPIPAAMPHGTAASAGGLAAKVVIAVIVAALVIAGTRIAGLWGGGAAERPAAMVKTTPPSTPPIKPAGSAAPAATARELPTIHEDDPKGTLRVEGQVIDEHDAPVANATVAIDANPPMVVTTESDGGFSFDGLIARRYHIEATDGVRYAGPAGVHLSEQTEPVTLRMRKGGTVEVTITERAGGAPLAGATVELRSWASTLTWSATTNPDGVAKLTGVGASWSPLFVRARGYAQAAMMLGTSGNPNLVERVALSLERGAALAGRVVDDKGRPVANARVVATSASQPEPVDFVDPERDAVTTGADGSFSFATLSAGTWRVTARAGQYAPTTTAPIAVDGTHARSGIEVRLLPGAVVRGTVKDASGARVPAATVSIVMQGYAPWRTRHQAATDATGTFSIGGLPSRAVDVVAWHHRGASAIVSVDLAATREHEVALTLAITSAIAGTVVDKAGRPIADAQVIATPDSTDASIDRAAWTVRGAQETTTDQSGAFRFAGLPDGSYHVRATRPSPSQATLSLATGVTTKPDAAPIKVVIPDDGRATGKVQLTGGKPATAFTIALAHTRPVPFVTKDGAFAISAPAGTYELTIAGPSFVTIHQRVTIDEGNDTDLGTFTVNEGRSISGRVLDEHGAPVAQATVIAGALLSGGGAELYIKSESMGAKDTVTDAQGRFVLAGFPPGSLTVVAGKANAGRSASVQLPASPDSVTLDLALGATSSLEGKVTRDGQPLRDTVIIANPIGAMWSHFFVTTGPDGVFAFDALAPGSYIVYPMLGRGRGPGALYMRRTEVVLGKTTKIEIDAMSGPITLSVSVKTDKGTALPMGQVGAIQLAINPQTAEELRDGTQMPTDRVVAMHGGEIRDGAASLTGLRAGTHTLCAMLGDPRIASSMKLACTQVKLTAAAKQSASLVVPAAWIESK